MTKKYLLVLGASSDFGCELIRQHADSSMGLIVHSNQSGQKLKKTTEIKKGWEILPVEADLSTEAGAQKIVSFLENKNIWPQQIVHLPAPKSQLVRFKDLTWDIVQKELAVQVQSLAIILKACIPRMGEGENGKVVALLSSYTTQVPPKYLTHYVIAKFALWGLLRSLAIEYADKAININAVSPSLTETAYLSQLPSKIVEIAADQSPLKRNAVPKDVIPLVNFLLSQDSNYMTGLNIPVAGGLTY